MSSHASRRFGHALVCLCLAAAGIAAQEGDAARSPQPPPVTEDALEARLGRARKLAEENKHAPALADYLFFFDNSGEVGNYGAVRLARVPAEIAELGRAYPPALAALRERRDAREARLLAGQASVDETQELASLNQHVKDAKTNVVIYDKLKQLGPEGADARETMLEIIWEELAAAKRYSEIGDKVMEYARLIAGQIAEYQIIQEFPDNSVETNETHLAFLRRQAAVSGGLVYEVMLGLGKTEAAEKFSRRLLTFNPNGEMYAKLIGHAVSAGNRTAALSLAEKAQQTLKDGKELEAIREAESRIPKGP